MYYVYLCNETILYAIFCSYVSSCPDPDLVMACCRKLLASSINDRMRQL